LNNITKTRIRPIAHEPSSPPKLLVPESLTSNFVKSVMHSGTRNLTRTEYNMCYYFHVSGMRFWTINWDGELGSCAISLNLWTWMSREVFVSQ